MRELMANKIYYWSVPCTTSISTGYRMTIVEICQFGSHMLIATKPCSVSHFSWNHLKVSQMKSWLFQNVTRADVSGIDDVTRVCNDVRSKAGLLHRKHAALQELRFGFMHGLNLINAWLYILIGWLVMTSSTGRWCHPHQGVWNARISYVLLVRQRAPL